MKKRTTATSSPGWHLALRHAPSTPDRGEENLGEWVVFLLRCLVSQTRVPAP